MSSKAAFLVRTAASVGSLEEICPSTSTVATEWVWSFGPCFLATTIRAEALLVESGPPGTRRSPVSWSHGLSYIWIRQNAKEILLMGCNEGRPLHERWQCWLELVLNEAPWQERFSKYFAEHRAQVAQQQLLSLLLQPFKEIPTVSFAPGGIHRCFIHPHTCPDNGHFHFSYEELQICKLGLWQLRIPAAIRSKGIPFTLMMWEH